MIRENIKIPVKQSLAYYELWFAVKINRAKGTKRIAVITEWK
jgi:hypothetical protein